MRRIFTQTWSHWHRHGESNCKGFSMSCSSVSTSTDKSCELRSRTWLVCTHSLCIFNLLIIHRSNVLSLLLLHQYFIIGKCCSPKQFCEAHLNWGFHTWDTEWQVSIYCHVTFYMGMTNSLWFKIFYLEVPKFTPVAN